MCVCVGQVVGFVVRGGGVERKYFWWVSCIIYVVSLTLFLLIASRRWALQIQPLLGCSLDLV